MCLYNSHGYTRSAKKYSHGLLLLQLSRKEPYFQDSKGLHTDNLTKKVQEIQKIQKVQKVQKVQLVLKVQKIQKVQKEHKIHTHFDKPF